MQFSVVIQLLSHVRLCVIPMNCSLPGSSVYGDSPYKNTGMGCHVFLQGIFPTQGLNLCLLCLLHWQEALWVICKFWRLILYWSHQQICKYFLPICGMSFCFVYFASFAVQKLLRVSRSHLFIFDFTSIILGDRSKKILLQFMSESILPMFSYVL